MDLFKRRKDGRLTQDEQRWLLTEMLCILKSLVPVGEDFQESLDTDFPATIGLLKDQAKAGMLNLVSHTPDLDKVCRKNMVRMSGDNYIEMKGAFNLESGWVYRGKRTIKGIARKQKETPNLKWLSGKRGFYLLTTWVGMPKDTTTLPRWAALVYYDGDKNHTPSGTNSTIYALILSLHWLSESERLRSGVETVSLRFNSGKWTPEERDLTRIYYLGPTCPEEDSIGIINWMW
jgi:hypothetical protein